MKHFKTVSNLLIIALLALTLAGCASNVDSVPAIVLPSLGSLPAPAPAPAPAPSPAEEAPVPAAEVVAPADELLYGVTPIVKDADSATDVYIAFTGDSHVRAIEGEDGSMGYSKLATISKYAQAYTDDLLLLDAGGTFVRPEYGPEVAGAVASAFSVIGYDAVVPGDSDYEYGYQTLLDVDGMMEDVALLSANTFYESNGDFLFQPYQVYAFGDFKVAVTGLTTPDTKALYPEGTEGVGFISDQIVANAQIAVDYLNQIADYVIVLGHIGNSDTITSEEIISYLDGIDLFIDGHNHESVNKMVGSTLLVSAGSFLNNVGVVHLTVDGNEANVAETFFISSSDVLNPSESALMKANGVTSVPSDSEIDALVAATAENLGL